MLFFCLFDYILMCLVARFFIRLEDRLRPNIGFTLRGDLTVITRSAITPQKVNRFGWNLEHSEYVVGSWSWLISGAIRTKASKNFVFFCQVNNARFHRFSFGQISRNLNTTSIGVTLKTFGTKFWKFYRKRSFFSEKETKSHKISTSYDFGPP